MTCDVPVTIDDPINKAILEISEDRIQGFAADPIRRIATESGVPADVVIDRITAMLKSGTIRRVRQTVLATSLAPGALVAWQIPNEKLKDAFEWMFDNDPFTGHVVKRTTDRDTPGSNYRLWTTIKVPRPYDLDKHCRYLMTVTGATSYKLLIAKRLFALGVGHVRRRGLEPGARTDEPGRAIDTTVVDVSERQWRVLMALKREFAPEELTLNIWAGRAEEAGESLEDFLTVARELEEMGVVGRFSTFLEHVKAHKDGKRVTKYNALYHWRVPEGKEIEAGLEVGRHHCMTHAYWREGGEEFSNVNIMGVSHGTNKETVLAHKAAIDQHLEDAGIPVSYTNVFWGGRSEIKPSEISPFRYTEWCSEQGISDEEMIA